MLATKKVITLILTEDCNFSCGYCYLVHKNKERRMPFEVARAAIDYVLTHDDLFWEDEVIWEFMGGESLLEVDLVEQLIDYIRQRTFELDHRWFAGSTFSISSNGALYHTPKVQRLVERHRDSLEIMITVDGPEHVHDAERVTAGGKGTYAQVVANVPLWLRQFPNASTKVTLARKNLPFLAESVLHLFSLGIKTINANVVFEDVWEPGDDALFEEQLDRLADAMLERRLYRDYSCSLFDETIGRPLDPEVDDLNWCGAGKMLAIDAAGNFYPCNRFLGFSLTRREARTVGNVAEGLSLNRVRPFLALTRSTQSDARCVSCEVASGCAWCQGHNYDSAETPTIYQRATYLCLMHQARVRANRRYFARRAELDGSGPGA